MQEGFDPNKKISRRELIGAAATIAVGLAADRLLPSDTREAAESAENAEKPLSLPHADAAIDLYREKFENNPEHIEKLKQIFGAMLEQGIANTGVFEAKESKAAFPWTVIKLPELARALYAKTLAARGQNVPEGRTLKKNEGHAFEHEREFVLGSAFAFSHGDEFVFAEEAMHQVIKRLPAALEDIRNGVTPHDFEVHLVGMPTNTYGAVSSQFSGKLQSNAPEAMGKLYAEFVADKSPTAADGSTAIKLYGISMGGGFAAKAGDTLMISGKMTQDFKQAKDTGLPLLQIQAMAPVSMGRSYIKPLQIPLGFTAEAAAQSLTNPAVQKIGAGMGAFQKRMAIILQKKGIEENMSLGQKALKGAALFSIITGLGNKISLDSKLKVTKVIGLKDPTMYTPSFNGEAQVHREKTIEGHGGKKGLGDNLVPEENKNQRTYGLDMSHTIPFFRESEFKRMKAAAVALEKLSS